MRHQLLHGGVQAGDVRDGFLSEEVIDVLSDVIATALLVAFVVAFFQIAQIGSLGPLELAFGETKSFDAASFPDQRFNGCLAVTGLGDGHQLQGILGLGNQVFTVVHTDIHVGRIGFLHFFFQAILEHDADHIVHQIVHEVVKTNFLLSRHNVAFVEQQDL